MNGREIFSSGEITIKELLNQGVVVVIIGVLGGCGYGQAEGIPDYQAARQVFWDQLYHEGGQTLYCAESFGTSRQPGLNVEHVFPMSWVTNALGCGTRNQCRERSELFNHIEADLHNLYPSRQEINEERSSYRFAEIAGESRRFGDCDFEVDYGAREAEPRPASRGEIARAMFYMENRYRDTGLEIFSSQARMLRRWHRDDPPGETEMRRNDLIEVLQGNRNPYIDHPAILYDE